MGEIKEQKTLEEEPPNLPSPLLSKRKPDVDSATEDSDPSKKLKKSDLETPIVAPPENHNSTAEVAREDKGSNGSPIIDKGKAVMRDDKGKGKAKVEEEEEEDSSSGSGDSSDDGLENGGGGGDDDGDVSDDPLAEVDLDNILPSRTRRRAAEPGAYLVNDMDDDDDDDDDDVEEDAEDEDSE